MLGYREYTEFLYPLLEILSEINESLKTIATDIDDLKEDGIAVCLEQ